MFPPGELLCLEFLSTPTALSPPVRIWDKGIIHRLYKGDVVVFIETVTPPDNMRVVSRHGTCVVCIDGFIEFHE